jgi:hypothetical protein
MNVKPEDPRGPLGGWGPGRYHCKCCYCGCDFIGDKRAVSCADCAYTLNRKYELSQDCVHWIRKYLVERNGQIIVLPIEARRELDEIVKEVTELHGE